MATNTDIGSVLKYISAAFPNFSPSPEMVPVWVDLLGHLPKETLWAAARVCLTQHGRQFAPSAAEILGAVADLQTKAAGVPTALEAWAIIHRSKRLEVRRCAEGVRLYEQAANAISSGYGQAVDAYRRHFETCGVCGDVATYGELPAVVEKVARGLGWPNNFPSDNPSADRAHFFKAYEAAVAADREVVTRVPSVQKFIEKGRGAALMPGNGDEAR